MFAPGALETMRAAVKENPYGPKYGPTGAYLGMGFSTRAVPKRRASKGRAAISVGYLLGLDLGDPEEARFFPGWLAKARVANLKEAVQRIELDRSRGVTPRPHEAARLEALRAELAKRGRRSKSKGSALSHHGGLNNPGTGREILLHGVLVIGGAAAAIKLDEAIEARPLGLPPSAYALAGTVAVVFVANKYKKRKLARGAAAAAIGMATGMVAKKLKG